MSKIRNTCNTQKMPAMYQNKLQLLIINIAEHFLTFGDNKSNKINSKLAYLSPCFLCPPCCDYGTVISGLGVIHKGSSLKIELSHRSLSSKKHQLNLTTELSEVSVSDIHTMDRGERTYIRT